MTKVSSRGHGSLGLSGLGSNHGIQNTDLLFVGLTPKKLPFLGFIYGNPDLEPQKKKVLKGPGNEGTFGASCLRV